MPRIQGYEQQYVASGQPPTRQANERDFGGTGLIEAGRGAQSLGQDLGFAQRQLRAAEEQRALTDVHTTLSHLSAKHTKRAKEVELQADPSDTTVGERFLMGTEEDRRGSLQDDLDGFRERFAEYPAALQAFDRGASDLVEHFSNHFVQVQVNLARAHAKQSAIQTIDNYQTVTLTDPSQYERTVNEYNQYVESLPVDQAFKDEYRRIGKEQIASSAVRGMIRDSPQHAKHSLEIGEWDGTISGEKKVVLLHDAETAIHAQQVAANQKLAEERRQLEELRHQTDRNLTAKYFLHLDNPGNPQYPAVTATEVAAEMAAGKLDGAVGRALMNMMEADSKEKTLKSDNSTYWNLFGRIVLPWGHTNKLTSMEDVYRAAAERKLTPTNVKQLMADFDKARDDTGLSLLKDREIFLNSMKSSITHSNLLLGKLDQEGDVNFGRFTALAIKEEAKAMKENRDPHDLYDESSKYYLGNKLGKYRKTMEQSLETISQGLKRAPTITEQGTVPSGKQRMPGETPQQYLDRMKK